MMKGYTLLILLIAATFVSAKKTADVTELQIGVKFKPTSCEIQAHKGDRIKVHYRGKLTDGTVFDSSFERGDPIEFELGSGQVIKVKSSELHSLNKTYLYILNEITVPGWDQGILGMCVGEKRKLKIPAKLGYGEQGSPPTIPGGATLIFDTELVAVNGKGSGEEETNDSKHGKNTQIGSDILKRSGWNFHFMTCTEILFTLKKNTPYILGAKWLHDLDPLLHVSIGKYPCLFPVKRLGMLFGSTVKVEP
ncbi:FK506- and rapamycin-binding protein [Artemisia annua]|uniref:peptidylprolyl isomerase n=1 Tax=Artemisia annua TaxID=35608 RepID=A0A2U1KBM0_ARTAN|nr:FK506- and rapamycin-binding protein [Artemisia annua]